MILLSLLNAPADTTGYYIAGYAIFFTVMILYLATFIIRSKNLKLEYELLTELDQEQ
jgi:hypothetical protein